MKITKEQFKAIVKEVMTEENEYQTFFQKALDKAGKSIPSMSDEEKKAFFDKIDSAWNGKGEKNEELVGGQKELDVDSDGDIEGDDLADLRAGKKADESVNEASYTVKADNPYEFINGATGILFRYSQDKKLDSGTRNTLQKVVKELEGLKKYFFSRKDESVNEGRLGKAVINQELKNMKTVKDFDTLFTKMWNGDEDKLFMSLYHLVEDPKLQKAFFDAIKSTLKKYPDGIV